jgi:ATP-dependent helicase IRC3
MTAPTLRPYQLEALDAVAHGREAGSNRLLEKMPTGTGKTVMFAELLHRLEPWLATFPAVHRKMLVIAHREELLDQAAEKIRTANPGLMVMVEQADRHASIYADVIVASIQTLAGAKFRRLKRFIERTTFRIVVVDEAHHAAAPTYRTALALLGFLPMADATDTENVEAATHDDIEAMTAALSGWDQVAPKDRLLLGVTATPNRSDAIGLGCVFQSIAFSYDLKQAIADGWLVPITPWSIETRTSLDAVHLAHGDFNQRELADAVNNAKRNQLAVAAWREHALGLPTIAFTVDVAHAHALAEAFTAAGFRARAVSGQTPKDERREMLAAFQAGQLDVLANCMVLTEGTDLPRAACILHAKPTKSATLYEQMTGRGLRLFPGKPDCVVIDLVDVARRHSLQAAPVLYGLPPGLLAKGQTLEAMETDLEALLARHQGIDVGKALAEQSMTLAQLQAHAATFDIWSIPSLGAFGAGRALNWLKLGEDRYRLEYPWADGYEALEVGRDLIDKWDVTLTLKPGGGGPVRQRTIAAQVATANDAAGLAEAFVLQERRSVMNLRGKDAPWRGRPASKKQLDRLAQMRVPPQSIPRNCTMGQASDLIDLAIARRSSRR